MGVDPSEAREVGKTAQTALREADKREAAGRPGTGTFEAVARAMERFLIDSGMSVRVRTDDVIYMRGWGMVPFVQVTHRGELPGRGAGDASNLVMGFLHPGLGQVLVDHHAVALMELPHVLHLKLKEQAYQHPSGLGRHIQAANFSTTGAIRTA